MPEDDIDTLREVIHDLHGLECTHLRSERVRETYGGATVWDGTVEVFGCVDGQATFVYAWSQEGDGELRYIAVLGEVPIGGPRDAVRAYLAAEETEHRV
jgi:hypothetical protein